MLPFKSIALAFSGGGFRAAGFALGTLAYLNRVPFEGRTLLENVTAVSTVSGGTITGAVFCALRTQRKTFNAIYAALYGFLDGRKFLDDALNKLENESIWRQTSKRRTLINAFALSYADLLINDDFGIFLKKPNPSDVIFNATDLNFGLPFRFQNNGFFGNKPLSQGAFTLQNTRKLVKIADVIASSSCFPFGFEPMIYPHDFIPHNSTLFSDLIKTEEFKSGVGLMDGGIVDNQGIKGLLLAQSRRQKEYRDNKESPPPFDLVIITDVASHYMDDWRSSKEKTGSWRNSTLEKLKVSIHPFVDGKYNWIGVSLLLIGVALTLLDIFVVNKGSESWMDGWLIVTGAAVGGAAVTVLLIQQRIAKAIKLGIVEFIDSVVAKIPKFFRPFLNNFNRIKLGVIERMIFERGSSAMLMISEIFLKQMRRLNYYQMYESDVWKFKRISNMIYELTPKDFQTKYAMFDDDEVERHLTNISLRREDKLSQKEKDRKQVLQNLDDSLKNPGSAIHEAATIASSMDTTLWFDDEHRSKDMLNHLVACGQYNACYNLLVYLNELRYSADSPCRESFTVGSPLLQLNNFLLEDWKKFRENPFELLPPKATHT